MYVYIVNHNSQMEFGKWKTEWGKLVMTNLMMNKYISWITKAFVVSKMYRINIWELNEWNINKFKINTKRNWNLKKEFNLDIIKKREWLMVFSREYKSYDKVLKSFVDSNGS